ncbi:MAG: LssY C-terminal domain-containing protein [Bryobacteraceae bacterium]
MSTPTGSRISHTGDRIEGRTIAPIGFRGQILVPQASQVFGTIESVKRFGLGLKHVTASIHYQFHTVRFTNGDTIPIQTEVLEVETAKERVDVDGTVRGIHPVASLSSSLSLFTAPLLFVVPTVGVPVWCIKSVIAPSANPEIYFPAGTELLLRLTAPVEIPSSAERPVGIKPFSREELNEVEHLLTGSEQRARMGRNPSDLVNVLFSGSREEMDRAFHAAGWDQAERKSPVSLYRMYHALTRRIGYKRAPMNALTLNGVPSEFVYQKSLDTVQKRHHVRLWKVQYTADAWLGAAAEDTGFRFKRAHWTHSTAPKIDNERGKVVNDLAFTGCLDAAELMSRHSPDLLQDPKSKQLISTDTDIAVVRLNVCNHPRIVPGVDPASSGDQHGRLSRGLGALRNDMRQNILFTTYNTLNLAAQRRALKPLRESPSIDSNPPGLDWLSSLPTGRATSSSARSPKVPSTTIQ